ncbi:hypothetical protein PCANC_05098 [Puccinia coronata f. sp. avenae]|uniref:Uncharacterized protein n=1 Tax=Puccinia coronata f. sp. avenae TaxID=200324 RepID=A0A2N5W389_9BASI|nr:hypothetical protein PCANC_05098 [Puccinia coronata f. sp. avenae]
MTLVMEVWTSMTWVHRAHQAGSCASPANSEPADLLAGLLAELAQVPALQAGLPARRAGSSPASRSTCSLSGYQLSKKVYLLAELVAAQHLLAELVAAQQAGLTARRAGTSSASRSTCSPSCSTCSLGWYQPSKRVYLLAELVPAQQAGQPACRAGTCTSPASRSACLRSRQAGQPARGVGKQADLLAGRCSGGVNTPPEHLWRCKHTSRAPLEV